MTWHASETPNDVAQQGDSLVAQLLRQGKSQSPPNDPQIGSSEPTTEQSSADQPGWMSNAIKSIRWRERFRMNLPKDWDPDRFPDI